MPAHELMNGKRVLRRTTRTTIPAPPFLNVIANFDPNAYIS